MLANHRICNGVRRLRNGQQRARVLEFSSVVKTGSALVRAWRDTRENDNGVEHSAIVSAVRERCTGASVLETVVPPA